MATPKKMTRADVYRQIDAFRGIAGREANGKPSPEQWAAARREVPPPPPRRAGNGKAMNHGWNRIRTD